MKMRSSKFRRLAAFSIAEVMMATAVGSLLMGGLMAGSVALQRTFDASDRQARSEADVNRLVDYVARDIGSATSINTTANGSVLLTVTKGDYYDRRGTPNDPSDDLPNNPVLGRYGAAYGASPITIKYLKTGTRISREVTQIDGGVTTITPTWIADDVDTFSVSLGGGGVATVSATFTTRYRARAGQSGAPSVTLTKQIYPRNPRS